MNAKVLGILVLLVLVSIFLSVAAPESFLKGNNIENLLRRTAMYGILGIGVAFVIITGGIDLSIGSIVCLSGCLLGLFLKVTYEPIGGEPVIEVRAQQRQIVLPGRVEEYQEGDRVRYYGGRRARNAMLTVTGVQQSDAQGDRATIIEVDQPLSRDDSDPASAGKIALVYDITHIDPGDFSDQDDPTHPIITIDGRHPGLAARDRLWFVEGTTGVKEVTVLLAVERDGTTAITVHNELGSIDTGWKAIPRKRRPRMSIAAALGAVFGIALLLGLIHGLLVTRMSLQPFIVTLCGLLIYRGVSRWIVDDQPVGFGDEYVHNLSMLASGKLTVWQSADGTDSFGIPYPFFGLLLIALVAAFFLNKTIWGRYMLALGRNEEAARYSGIHTNRMMVIAYMICTVLAMIGGMLFALDSNSVSPSSFGNFFELYAIAAAVLGGCSLRGGEGGILGIIIGTALMQTLKTMIVLLKISDTLEFAIIGMVLLLGVTADELVKRIAARRKGKAV